MKSILLRFRVFTKRCSLRIFLTFINSLQSKKFDFVSNLQMYDFSNSGIFYKASKVDFGRTYLEWELADRLWRVGEYRKSVEIRKHCLEFLYESEGISDSDYVPPLLSVSWTSAFGHIGSLGIFSTAQRLGIVSTEKRIVLVRNQNSLDNITRVFKDSFVLTPSRYGHSALEHPSQWHISERLQMIKSEAGFICLYDLYDRVFKELDETTVLPQVDIEYSEWARSWLTQLGLPRGSWFASLHIRDNFGEFDARSASSDKFSDAVDEVIRLGGWVIQFGTNSTQWIQPRKGLIRLDATVGKHHDLHLYLLSHSKFLLTTNSGPSVIAWSLGTPVLQTNTTSIARNLLRASRNSLFLPKRYTDGRGRELAFREIAQGRLGYSESSTKELAKIGIQISENTSTEILEATRDIMQLIEGQESPNKLMERLNIIRSETSAVGFGEVAPSFLLKNSDWFLN